MFLCQWAAGAALETGPGVCEDVQTATMASSLLGPGYIWMYCSKALHVSATATGSTSTTSI